MSIALVTDSTCDLSKEVLAGLDVTVVPLYILFGETSFRQDVDLDTDAFFKKQREALKAGELPHTSQPTAGDFLKVYRELLSGKGDGKGHETIVSVHISSDMSGTIQSATMARDELREQFAKENKEADIRIVDSRNVSIGLGFLVIEADRLLKEGKSADDLVAALDDLIARVRVIFYVGTLEYLHKGGRIGTARALLGALLRLKLILQVKDGRVQPLAKVRKKDKLFRKMIGIMKSDCNKDVQGMQDDGGAHPGHPVHPCSKIALAHGDAPADRDSLLAVMPEEYRDRIMPARIGGVVGCHAGPEVVGIAYLRRSAK